MNPIIKENYTEVGFVQKPHGLKGEVVLIPEGQYEEIFESIETCFLEIEGGLVPVFISEEGVKYRNDGTLIVKFDYIDDQEKAKEIAGCKVFISDEEFSDEDIPESYSGLLGMKVIDQTYGELGSITALDDFSGNIVITVQNPKGEILIPLSEEIIESVDEEQNSIYLNCPEGLVDIYLNGNA
jgi:16S rRNA processing protein RimM